MSCELQNKIISALRAKNYLVLKTTGTGATIRGIPDIIVFASNGRCVLIEIKGKGDKLSSIQNERIQQLRNLRYKVIIATEETDPGQILEDISRN